MTLPVQIQSDEQVIAVLRRHPVYITLQIIGIIVLAMLFISAFIWMQSLVDALRSIMDILIILTAVVALGGGGTHLLSVSS